MPLTFGQSNITRFTPKEAKVSDLYKSISKGSSMPASVKTSAIQALQKAGYNSNEISKIISKNEAIPVAKLKQIAGHLKTGNVYGFSNRNPEIMVKQYLNKQRLKNQSIARIRKEHMLEERAEDSKSISSIPKSRDAGVRGRVNLPF